MRVKYTDDKLSDKTSPNQADSDSGYVVPTRELLKFIIIDLKTRVSVSANKTKMCKISFVCRRFHDTFNAMCYTPRYRKNKQ